ncbi:glucose dehydrogenase [FAD, quinone]-like [Onthophagus taurus]|uniref:glucose dehydrogenase [FAD, quinone]-like n=1 Tax=Onthophagus taurus TaxID=166361 RepID=UPI0039BDA5A4
MITLNIKIVILIITLCKTNSQITFNANFSLNFNYYHTFFDYVIVGSGAAGSVVASRLSENPNLNILVLEAGIEPIKLVDIPAICATFQFTDYNWGYLMEEQENMCLGLQDKRMHWPRGKVIGGSTVINYMIHIRGNRLDFDRWAKNGNKGWSYTDVLPLFKKSEDCSVERQDKEFRNIGGELGVQDVAYRTKSAEAFVEAMQEYGYKYVDYNGESQIGVSWIQATTRRGKRESATRAFLDVARRRSNLRIISEARAEKVVFYEQKEQNDKLKAHGVEFYKNGQKYIARATKEVILSAGALNTPQILMLSGIGPKNHLDELEIPVLKDLPVGRKLYDHLAFLGLMFTMDGSDLTINYDEWFESNTILRYIIWGDGPLSGIGGVEALGIVKTRLSDDPDPNFPDIELIFLGGNLASDRGDVFRKSFRISDEVYDAYYKPLEGKQAFTIIPMLYHPKSYGKIELKSRNPFARPKFYGNYFTDKDNFDVKTLITGIRLAQEIVSMPAFQKYNSTIVSRKVPGCEYFVFNSDEYWECALRHLSVTLHHQVATCKMGNTTDPEAVVDDTLTVYGTENLRVADTSIIPEPITAHTNIPAFMIGEKLADIITRI